jgi:hypothetical protein
MMAVVLSLIQGCAADPLVADLRSGSRPLGLHGRASDTADPFATPNFRAAAEDGEC